MIKQIARTIIVLQFLTLTLHSQTPPAVVRLTADSPDFRTRFAPRWYSSGQRRIAISLRGGSAKGLAHVGVLQRFEEEGIPLDGISGTSAGAFVGALASAGFSGSNMARVFQTMDLGTLLDDRRRSAGISLSEEELRTAHFLSVDFQNGQLDLIPGKERTRKVQGVLRTIFAGTFLTSGNDFDRLRIPIRVVATDLQTGEPWVFRSGFLADAVQASMTIPGLLVPPRIDGHQLVDGGLVDNFPIATSKVEFPGMLQVGVDISRTWDESRVTSLLSLLNRSLDTSIRQNEKRSQRLADLLITPVTDKAGEFDFHSQVEMLVTSGREAFDRSLPLLEQMMYGPEAERVVAHHSLLVAGELDQTMERLIQASLPSDGPICLRDLYRLLRRVYVHRPVAEAWVELPSNPSGRARLHLRHQPKIQRVILHLPKELTPIERARYERGIARPGLQVGDYYFPVALDTCLTEFSLYGAIPGHSFVRFSSSSFNELEGVLSIVGTIIPVKSIDVMSGESGELLRANLQDLIGQPVHPADILQRIESAREHFGLSAFAGESKTLDDGLQIKLIPQRESSLSLSFAPAFESSWGAHIGVGADLRNPFGFPLSTGLQGAVNSLQQRVTLFVNRESMTLPGFGIYGYMNASQQRFESNLFLVEQPSSGFSTLRVRHQASGIGARMRFSNTNQGLIRLTIEERRSSYSDEFGDSARMNEQTIQLSGEWDDLDFHLLPTQGSLFRLRYGQSFHLEGISSPFRFAYARLRHLQPIPSLPFGVDIDFETVLGWHTPITRWNTMGGNGSIIGTRSASYLVPNASIARFGLPFTSANIFGAGVQVMPRLDWGRFSPEPGNLRNGPRVVGVGVAISTIIRNFNVEMSFGGTQMRGGDLSGTRKGSQFVVLVGTRPFDLWKQM